MTVLCMLLWFTALLWLGITDLLYMKLTYPALILLAISGIGRVWIKMPGSGQLVWILLIVLLTGSLFYFACRRKQMGIGDVIVLMILGLVYPADQLLFILSLGFMLAGMSSILIIWTKQGERLPLVPFLGIGCMLAELLG